MGILRKKETGEGTTFRAKPNGDTSRSLIDIELALAEYFGWKRNIIAFNVLGVSSVLPIGHECDMLVVTPSGYLTEIEIKRSYADFCADFKKEHHHTSRVPLKDFYYAVPAGILPKVTSKLVEERVVPSRILVYDEDLRIDDYPVYSNKDTPDNRERREWLWEDERTILLLMEDDGREVTMIVDPNHSNMPLFLEQQLEIARLGAMRQMSLRKRLVEQEERLRRGPDQQLLTENGNLKVLLREYRERFLQETGYRLDENEVLFG